MNDSLLPDFILETSENKVKGVLGGLALHSKYRPGEEIRGQCEKLAKNKNPVFVIGMGLGHHFSVVLDSCPNRRLIFVEPHPGVWDWIQTNRQGFFQNKNLVQGLFIQPDSPDLRGIVKQLIPGDGQAVPELLVLPAYKKCFPEFVKTFEDRLKIVQERQKINSATLKRFGKLWLRNSMRNVPIYSKAIPVQKAFGHFQEIPAILLAGGPSLDKILPRLSDLREFFLLVAVDTAVRPCMQMGVEPDFIVMVDPQYWNTRHLDWVYSPHSIFVTEISVHPGSLHHMARPPLLSGSIFPLGQFVENDRFQRLGAGGSVATTGWDFIHHLGIQEIFCTGLDLGFPEMKTHTRGSLSEEMSHHRGNRFCTVETLGHRFLNSRSVSWTQDYAGRPVMNDKRMDVYAAWFEARVHAASTRGVQTYNLGSASRAIQGITPVSLGDLHTSRPSLRGTIDRKILDLMAHSDEGAENEVNTPSEIVHIFQKIDSMLGEAREIHDLARKAIDQINSFLATNPLSSSILIENLNTIDEQIMELQSRKIIGFLLEDIFQEIQAMDDPADLESSLQRSLTMYQGLMNSCHWILTELKSLESPQI